MQDTPRVIERLQAVLPASAEALATGAVVIVEPASTGHASCRTCGWARQQRAVLLHPDDEAFGELDQLEPRRGTIGSKGLEIAPNL
jgi:hypothetical protein